jgi:ABC-type branched-subunit amino acid transport system ATPase component/ABC-type branched-subunit amino acid transport system permease subunit
LWWLLGHTAFGDAVRAAATNADLARMTGINPKMVSTGVWAIAGFLATMAVFLTATDQVSSDLVHIGPDTLLRGMAAALIGGMVSFPRAMLGGILIGIVDRVLFFNYTTETGLVQFVLFLAVLLLVAVVSRRDTASSGESFQFAPRVAAIPERLRNIWWVKRLPQFVAGIALLVAVVAPFIVDKSEKHQTWTVVIAFALCAVSVVVLTGWGGQLSLGQMAFAGLGALTAAALIRGLSANIGWHDVRIINGSIGGISFPWAMILGASFASLVAVLVGVGALRVRGLLLAVSTLAFAIAAQLYLFNRPFFTAGFSTIEIPRSDIGPLELTHRNRAYFYFVLAILVLVLLLVGHLKRTGVGRMIVGVRENELAAAAMTVSPARAKLIAFALGGFIAGLGGVLLGAVNLTFGPSERYFLVEDSIRLISIAVIGGLGSLSGAVVGALWVVGLPAFWPQNEIVPLFTSSIGLLLILLYIPGGFVQIGHYVRDSLLRWVERRMGPPPPTKTATAPPASLRRADTLEPARTNADGSVLTTSKLSVHFGGLIAVNEVDFKAFPREVIGLIGNNGAGKSTLLNAIGGFVPSRGSVMLLGRDVSKKNAHKRARAGLGRTFQAARLYPELTVRDTIELALEARKRTSFWGSLLWLPSIKVERRKTTEAAELVDFLGLGRYRDRYIAELSTGTRRIVELATVLAVAPRVICLDEPTAGVAQREAEAFGPLILRVQQELDATLVVVEHDLPLILSISNRVYCLEAGTIIAEGAPGEIRDNPRVVASYLGTDERAIQRSNA